jgi:predicted LPLAT superfamily acyltransferase
VNIRPLIAVPTFDNPDAIAGVVRDLVALGAAPVLVVDDGSAVPVSEVLYAAGVRDGHHVERHAVNRGKGAALRTAFGWALARGYTHVLTIDGDGQHLASEVPHLLAAAEADPWSLVIGARRFPAEHVPGASRFGRAFSDFWVRYETGVRVGDSQSGMRVYPLFHVQCLGFSTRRYDFEVEALTRLVWAGAGVVEVPIEVVYPPADRRVSHFRKVRDNARISLLNVRLVTLSLFKRHLGGEKLALASLVAAPIATCDLSRAAVLALLTVLTVVLQLNGFVVLLWLLAGSLVQPAISAAGAWWGVCAAAAVCALLLTTIAHLVRTRPRTAWSGRMRGGRFGNAFLKGVSRRLGLGATYVCLAAITPYFYAFAPRARRSAHEFYRAVRPDASAWARRGHIVRNFYTFGMVLLDRLFQSFHARSVFAVDVRGRPVFDRAVSRGRGAIMLTAHAGGWDLSARVLASSGISEPVLAEFVAAGRASSESTLRSDEAGLVARASFHNEASPLLAYRERLERGEVIGMMGDRPLTSKLALVPFFGKLAAFDLTPFRVAMSLGVDVVYCFAFKTGFRSYTLSIEAAPDLRGVRGADKEAACEAAARHFAAALEAHLREHPHQWFNFFPFFSTRPAELTALR